jgi:HpcH/HpaI aldolase/citrate lyase family
LSDLALSSFGAKFRFTLITADARLAARADRLGVERVGVDLERLGKPERQAREDTRLSDHCASDLAPIAGALRRALPFARINPIQPDSAREIEAALAMGARVLMLPFFKTAEEVERFVQLTAGRARTMILIETGAALVRARDILAVPGVDEVMAGLNDLRLQLGVKSHFEVLASPLLDGLSAEARRANLPFSVGGVARADDASLPVPSDLVLAQYPRLQASGAWLSRSFFNGMPEDWDFAEALAEVRRRLTEWSLASADELERARARLAAASRELSWS